MASRGEAAFRVARALMIACELAAMAIMAVFTGWLASFRDPDEDDGVDR